MATDTPTGFDESTESMALLGPHKRIPDPTLPGTAAALAHKSRYISPRLEIVLSQCPPDGDIERELWDDFEVQHRSANTYMGQYLDCMPQVHDAYSGHVYEIDDFDDEVPSTDLAARPPDSGAVAVTREEWKLKISHDSLVRDLLAMHETLDYLKRRNGPLPSKSALPIGAGTIFVGTLGWVLWQRSQPAAAIGCLALEVIGSGCYYLTEIGNWLRTKVIEQCQKNIEALCRRLNRGQVDERDRGLRRLALSRLDCFRK